MNNNTSSNYKLISIDEIEFAYRKLKSTIYHDNFSLSLRIKLSEFENADIKQKFESLAGNINNMSIEEYLETIDVIFLPKKFKKADEIGKEQIFYHSNINTKNNYILEQYTAFIDCPIELHIISVLWIMKIGYIVDDSLSEQCYSNRLMRNKDNLFEQNSIKLFNRYYLQYNKWRDDAIKMAKSLHKLNLDVGILNLDIKNYYHSIDFKFDSLKIAPSILKDYGYLNTLLEKIHKSYLKRLNDYLDENTQIELNILPIGILSSQILSNYYLSDLDKTILKNIKPAFYGRYVDDILIVFANPIFDTQKPNTIIDKYLVAPTKKDTSTKKETSIRIVENNKSEIISEEKDNTEYNIEIIKDKIVINKLSFQNTKVKLYHFLGIEHIHLLDEFEKELRNNSSEFRFLPDSQIIFDDFERSSFVLSYSDTVNKLRSLEGISASKYGASKHLSKLIYITQNINQLDKTQKEECNERIITFFQGQRGLELNGLWEKVFTLFIMNGDANSFINFLHQQIDLIDKIQYEQNNKITKKIQDDLFHQLAFMLYMAISLNVSFFKNKILSSIQEYSPNKSKLVNALSKGIITIIIEKSEQYAKHIIDANMLRHNYVAHPLLNYTNISDTPNFLDGNNSILFKPQIEILEDSKKIKYSPRFIHYHELSMFYFLKKFNNFNNDNNQEENNNLFFKEILSKYIQFNKMGDKINDRNNNSYPKEISEDSSNKNFNTLKLASYKSRNHLKIGIVSINVDINDSISSIKNQPNLTISRLDNIFKILNEAINSKHQCDLVVFPEISIPYRWLSLLAKFSKTNNLAIICGVEHFIDNNKQVFNYVATILPFKDNNYNNALIDFRLKKDYSPSEIEEIEGRKYKIPTDIMDKVAFNLYNWNNIYFTVFNCYELTDIKNRALFKAKVDFLCAIEYNQDINYFSNITESVARDIHTYVIQVNTANWGDSRIIQPTDTNNKDIIRIKGGDNVSITIGTINIKELREFQALNHNLQKKRGKFKQTPPRFDNDCHHGRKPI